MAKQQDRRVHIIRTAARVFMEHGYEAASMNLIARHSKVTKQGVYYHFESKQDLLFAVVSRAMDFLDEALEEVAASGLDDEALLEQILYRHALIIAREETGAFTLLVIDLPDGLSPENRRDVTRRKRAYFETVRSLLERLAAEGRLRDVDATVGAFSILGMVMWISKWFRATGPVSDEEVARQVAALALSAVLRDDRRRSSGTARLAKLAAS